MRARNKAGVQLITGDALLALDDVDNGSVQLAVTSPPYNIGKPYEREQQLSLEEYIEWLNPIVNKMCNKIAPEGSICWQVGNFVHNGEVFPLDYFFYKMFSELGLKLRNRIIWQFNFGLHATKRFSGRYETILWFTKGDTYKFNLDAVRVPQIYPGKRHSQKKGEDKAGRPSGNPLGKNPSDFWTFSAEDCFTDNLVWQIPNVKANHPEYTIHPCQFPHELVERCVLAFSDPGDVVLDPFVGAGTTIIAAVKAQRQAIGIDKDENYIALATQRLTDLEAGNLRLRKSGSNIHKPSAHEKLVRRPSEWSEAAE